MRGGIAILALVASACSSATTLRIELTSSVEISSWAIDLTLDGAAILSDYTLPVRDNQPRIGALGAVVVVLPDADGLARATVHAQAASGEGLSAVSDAQIVAKQRATLSLALGADQPSDGGVPEDLGDVDLWEATDLDDGKVAVTIALTVGATATAPVITSTPAGIVCGATCTMRVAPGTQVTLSSTNPMRTYVDMRAPCGGGLRECRFIADADVTVTVLASAMNYAFVTSTDYGSDLGGVAGADAKCMARAAAANLAGTYKAWISSSTVHAKDRFGSARGWIRLDGRPFADTMAEIITHRIFYPIRVDEFGVDLGIASPPLVLTGTNAQGTWSGDSNGTDWTVANQVTHGGYYYKGVSYWTDFHTGVVGATGRLYCLGTDFATTLPDPAVPAQARRAFFSTTSQNGGGGPSQGDVTCVNEATAASLPNPTRFKALLATTTASPAARFDTAKDPWYRVDGVRLSATAQTFFSGQRLDAFFALTASGAPQPSLSAWVGTDNVTAPGTTAQNCTNWSDNTNAVSGRVFLVNDTIMTGLSSSATCNGMQRLMCLED